MVQRIAGYVRPSTKNLCAGLCFVQEMFLLQIRPRRSSATYVQVVVTQDEAVNNSETLRLGGRALGLPNPNFSREQQSREPSQNSIFLIDVL